MPTFTSTEYEIKKCECYGCENNVHPDNEVDIGIGLVIYFSDPIICEECYSLIEGVSLLLELLFNVKFAHYQKDHELPF
jgi:hypothetical protein